MEEVSHHLVAASTARALALTPRRGEARSGECAIRWLEWGDPRHRSVIFVHGGAAHAAWWSFTAPLLANHHHVVVLELSGHGESDRRSVYTFAAWAEEVAAVAAAVGGEPPVVVGHSMGGIVVSLLAGHPVARQLAGLVVVDAPVVPPPGEVQIRWEPSLGRCRTYPDRASAVAAFRLHPPQTVAHGELVQLIAESSVEPCSDGGRWTWRFDPVAFRTAGEARPSSTVPQLQAAPCPVGYVVGGASTVLGDADHEALERLAKEPHFTLTVVPGAAHHMMLDRPLELVDAISDLLKKWIPSSRP